MRRSQLCYTPRHVTAKWAYPPTWSRPQSGCMTTTLITGANRSLGLETARRLVEAGHTVYAGMRDPDSGDAARSAGARIIRLDVTDQQSVDAAIVELPQLDVLINNAGILGDSFGVDDLDADAMAAVLDTNVVGIVRVTQAVLPLLRRPIRSSLPPASAGPAIFRTPPTTSTRYRRSPTRPRRPPSSPSRCSTPRTSRTCASTPQIRVTPPPTSTGTTDIRQSPKAQTPPSRSPPSTRTDQPANSVTAPAPSRTDRLRPCGLPVSRCPQTRRERVIGQL